MRHFLPFCWIALFLLTGCRTADYTKGQSDICVVHHIQMTKRTVPIIYGMPALNEAFRQRQAFYPHSGDVTFGGCIFMEEKRSVVYVCPKCDEAMRDLKGKQP